MNAEKSKVTSIFAQKNFKFLGFCLGKNGNGIFIRAHRKSLAKAKENAEASYKAKPRAQCLQSDAGSEDIYPWLDRLFSSSRYEADADVLG